MLLQFENEILNACSTDLRDFTQEEKIYILALLTVQADRAETSQQEMLSVEKAVIKDLPNSDNVLL
jgi:hypothetical protein